ncbi:MAG: acyl carrier protein [Phycisphaeraceae bacterium]|nr:MAG: acyl carrier protein [Phycisphaeraceae bacterium]
MTRDEIYAKVKEILVDALAVDDEDVTPQARLTTDLGAESIDFLDIVFKLQQAFGLNIAQGELFPENLSQHANFVKDGKVTPEGIATLKSRLPHVDFSGFEADPQVKKVAEVFTVDAVVKFVERKLASG